MPNPDPGLHRQSNAELMAGPYTTSTAFFEAIWEAGITHCFVNLGSDHPSIIEAIVRGQKERQRGGEFVRVITCPNEMVALSMADGFARYTNKPQCVIVHVDVGTQGLGAAVHNASTGRAPVLIFAGLSPYTIEGEIRGSRTEYIHWMQDVPDQKQIVAQYCRYTGEIKTGKNVKQMVNRALSFAMSDPKGPVYLYSAREAMEEEIEPYQLDQAYWKPVGPSALPTEAIKEISEALLCAQEPLVITGYSGRNHRAPTELEDLAEVLPRLRVLDTGGSDMCFPAHHPAWLGLRYGVEDSIISADVIVVLDCDVPWIPTQCSPKADARIFHIDSDPLKQQMPVFYINALSRFRVDSYTALNQLRTFIQSILNPYRNTGEEVLSEEYGKRIETHLSRLKKIDDLASVPADCSINTSYLIHTLRSVAPSDTIWVVEAVTNTALVADQIQATIPGTWLNCGGGGLGWSGGAALGIKLASMAVNERPSFVCQIVGDGTFLFSVPGSVYWIAERYKIPILTIILNNKGWNAPRKSLLLVHPEGEGSKVSNEELNISFEPSPNYADIAKAAAGGKIWARRVSEADQVKIVLQEAVKWVIGGHTAVLDAVLGEIQSADAGDKAALKG
ncbi:acetolactate synthase-like protein catalytic subunit [Saccharata proteae CBS 121410]|uniref:Acetolactate synthase-like protein catalytic subunit n=1 Tax=Saccharata proteae CBS 121410 TaxID=1314787 RepID=A0A6A5YE06_9PEZI|nr:acetolactate synthase-like protein catalytic subunit [Saccharata proteae CBS 121410]